MRNSCFAGSPALRMPEPYGPEEDEITLRTHSLPFEDIPEMVPYAGDIAVTAPWRTRAI